MKKLSTTFCRSLSCVLILLFFVSQQQAYARAGGGGGGGHGGGGGGGFGGGGFHSSGGGYSGGGGGSSGVFVIAIIIVIIVVVATSKAKKAGGGNDGPVEIPQESKPFPADLPPGKVQTSFLAIQIAWENKDLKNVRKWISDGIYQRYTAQFGIMNKLEQVNRLSNIRINGIQVVKNEKDAGYETADVAVSFTMNDEFVSKKYPSFNESFEDDSAIEYWTFIKKDNGKPITDLYTGNNCPNCGALLDIKLGEICRCSSCGTLTNNASYDWVLSEITQEEDYDRTARIDGEEAMMLYQQMKNDTQFSIQRVEDIASNVFMQIMQVLSGDDAKRLKRFADATTVNQVLSVREKEAGYTFNRLYLNDVTLTDFKIAYEQLHLNITLTATFQLVRTGQQLQLLDSDMTEHIFGMTLSKNISALKTPAKETVFSFECPCCGAPYTDTTDATCTYCGEPVVDLNQNWVLTNFSIPSSVFAS